MDFATHYYPNVLEAMRTRWISPQFVATNRIDGERGYDEVREMGRAVIRALGIGTSATHMEWFAGPKGLYFSEIGCRPPGVRCWDLYAAGNDIDIYGEWAMAVVHGRVSRAPSRRFSAGIIALRPDRDGSITHYDGVDEIQARHGEWVIDAHLPPAGTATQPRRGRVHGQRLDPHAPPRLRRPPQTCSTTSAAPSRSTPVTGLTRARLADSCSPRLTESRRRRYAAALARLDRGAVTTCAADRAAGRGRGGRRRRSTRGVPPASRSRSSSPDVCTFAYAGR